MNNKTIRKRTFYIIFSAIVRNTSAKDIIDLWPEANLANFPTESINLALKWDEEMSILDELIISKTSKNSVNSIPKTDLAIIYTYLTSHYIDKNSKKMGNEIIDFANEFGSTQSSADFCYAIFNNCITELP